MTQPRLILFHKQATSARTRFMRHAYGGVCAFDPLPPDGELLVPGDAQAAVVSHPATLALSAERRLGLPAGGLEPQPGFRFEIRSGAEVIGVYLARFTATDPPFALAQAAGGAFIDLTQARGLPALELALLRLAYEQIMG